MRNREHERVTMKMNGNVALDFQRTCSLLVDQVISAVVEGEISCSK